MANRRRGDRPAERPAVRTTIVGGRPPGSGQAIGSIPRGLEVLVKKATVDPEFKEILLEKRAGAARGIGLALEPAEAAMLGVIPSAQLEAIIAGTKVGSKQRRAFLGKAAAVMIAALGAGSTTSCIPTVGITADAPLAIKTPGRKSTTEGVHPDPQEAEEQESTKPAVEGRPVVKGIRPGRVTKGIRPDRPKRKE